MLLTGAIFQKKLRLLFFNELCFGLLTTCKDLAKGGLSKVLFWE